METFYNINGQSIAYIDSDKTSIYFYDGTPVAWMVDENIYAYSGRYLGWITNGWIYDRNGNPAFFTDNTSGGPLKPMRAMKPMRGMRGMKPMRGMRESRPLRPSRSLNWSILSNENFFTQ